MDEVNSIGSLENIFFKMQIEVENLLNFKQEEFDEWLKKDKCLIHKRMIQSFWDQLDKVQSVKLKMEEENIKLNRKINAL